MIAYASRTGTKRNLAAMRRAGWRIMVSATGVWDNHGFRYALDNGAWTASQQGTEFDADKFRGVVRLLGADADFTICPDIVSGGLRSLAFSSEWLPWLRTRTPKLLLAVQDGMTPADIPSSGYDGIFLGGSTAFKEETMPEWGMVARARGLYFHVGRVNTRRRIRICQDCGADSFDGTSVSRFASTLPMLNSQRLQMTLLADNR